MTKQTKNVFEKILDAQIKKGEEEKPYIEHQDTDELKPFGRDAWIAKYNDCVVSTLEFDALISIKNQEIMSLLAIRRELMSELDKERAALAEIVEKLLPGVE